MKEVVIKAQMKPRIGLVTLGGKKALAAAEANLRIVSVLEPLASRITWVAINCFIEENKMPSKVTLIRFDLGDLHKEPFLKQVFYELLQQIRIILKLRKLREVDLFFFATGGYTLLFPFLFTTLFLRKKTILRIGGRSSFLLRRKAINGNHRILRIVIYSLMERVMYSLAHRLALEYELAAERYNLQKYKHKIGRANQYVDTALFKKTKEWAERAYQVGYFGRLSKEKGVLEFAQALPLIWKDIEGKGIIIGDGELREETAKILADNNIQSKAELTGWVENEKVADYLNDVKLVIVPAYWEGIPKIVLEAMACGTLVLAPPIGGIPDLIKDGETGFIMQNNSPECIARNVIRVLNHPDIEQITRNARELMERDFSYGVTVERYRKILSSVSRNS